MPKYNADERYILSLANTMTGVIARTATREEDCGYQKADVVLNFEGKDYYIQVSHQQKSITQRAKLLKRGTFFVHVFDFGKGRRSDAVIIGDLERLLGK